MTEAAAPVIRWLLFTAILVTVGAPAFHLAVLGRFAARDGAGPAADLVSARAALLGLCAATLVPLAATARFLLQAGEFRDPGAPLAPVLRLLLGTPSGSAFLVQCAAAALAVIGFAMALRSRRGGWTIAAAAALVLAFTPAFWGHAIAAERTALAVSADGLHVLGAGCWIGAVMCMLAGLGAPRAAGRPDLAGVLVAAFAPLALSGAATVVVTGVVSSALHLRPPSALWTSRYGFTLLVKAGMALAVMLVGAVNWRRVGPKLLSDGNERPVRRSIAIELLIALLVLAVTASLVATPPPGEE